MKTIFTAQTSADGRLHQKNRTRRHITEAAMRLRGKGLLTSLADVADEAQVSRATVYRYFTSIGDLQTELALAVQIKEAAELFDPADPDPLHRALEVHAHLFDLVRRYQPEFRAYLKSSMEHWERNAAARMGQLREGRRARLLNEALDGLRDRLGKDDYEKLVQALSLVTFIEPFILLKDIFGLSDAAADETMRWAIERLVTGALSLSGRSQEVGDVG